MNITYAMAEVEAYEIMKRYKGTWSTDPHEFDRYVDEFMSVANRIKDQRQKIATRNSGGR